MSKLKISLVLLMIFICSSCSTHLNNNYNTIVEEYSGRFSFKIIDGQGRSKINSNGYFSFTSNQSNSKYSLDIISSLGFTLIRFEENSGNIEIIASEKIKSYINNSKIDMISILRKHISMSEISYLLSGKIPDSLNNKLIDVDDIDNDELLNKIPFVHFIKRNSYGQPALIIFETKNSSDRLILHLFINK